MAVSPRGFLTQERFWVQGFYTANSASRTGMISTVSIQRLLHGVVHEVDIDLIPLDAVGAADCAGHGGAIGFSYGT